MTLYQWRARRGGCCLQLQWILKIVRIAHCWGPDPRTTSQHGIAGGLRRDGCRITVQSMQMYTRERWLFRPFTARTRACHNGSTNWIKDSLAVRGITRDWRRARCRMMDYYPKWTVSPEGILASAGIRIILWRYYGGSERIRRTQMMSTKSANLHHVGFDILFTTGQYFASKNCWETKKFLRTTTPKFLIFKIILVL